MQNKKKPKDTLTHKQFEINKRSDIETTSATNWISSVGINVKYFDSIDIKLLQAQKQAHMLLTHNIDLLTSSQIETLQNFQNLMAHKNTREKIKPTAAYPVFNISTKINRQLFKQHRSLTKVSH